ncbi:MAG TPA: transcription antitermination factor NusB [Gemmataceae bacterium]|nr:transcription antitermination factor NusB [Gemmataceae bacterium]
MLTRRSRAREVALQLLFQHDHNPNLSPQAIAEFAKERLRDPNLVQFCLALFDGVTKEQTVLDQRLNQASENWRVPRMPTVDRNVLRLGAYELLYTPHTPAPAVLDEAIELARRFGTKDSPAFVNGVLDRLKSVRE